MLDQAIIDASQLREAALKDTPDAARILCYTNRTLERLVPHVRRAIHGEMADQLPVLPGEVLISRRAIMSSATIEGEESEEEIDLIQPYERDIDAELKSMKKMSQVSPEVTTRLKYAIVSINGDENVQNIRTFVDQHLLSRDSIALRREITRISPDIELSQDIELGGETVKVNIPMTVGFFWPEA